jgi:transposase-like protein
MTTISKRQHTPACKFDVAVKALMTDKISEVGRQCGVSAGLVSKWVTQLKTSGAQVYITTPDKEIVKFKAEVKHLTELVGKKELELSLMKNFVDFYTPPRGT